MDNVIIVALVIGLGFGAGLWLVWFGLRPTSAAAPRRTRLDWRIDRRRLLHTLLPAIAAAVVTRWPVAAVGAGLLGWFGPELFGGRAGRDREVARTEAIASWTEMLRDTMSGAHGLEEAIITSAEVAPSAILLETTALAVRLEREPLDFALSGFGNDLAHPMGDLVVTALTLAATGATGDLSELLGTLAVAARDEAAMRLRVEASRARLRTAVRVIAGVTAATAVGLFVLNRGYVDVYRTPAGQMVLATVALSWGVALAWLARMSQFTAPERFLVATPSSGTIG